ncbi:Crp/Fnr family transcriptional regulator [Chryseobacterium luquanense]|uniref:Crp/Fnr family transcriptional regulator n=1 Tax=Chryseobacterium luquanense TaxID=2983766 RepID=A0ABT3XY64_9FLAO|nr:Crp/Fnr family transcriptional regulator [Chryseobacterium luquanense]MCX8530834.1 Crp/Fnr family transcriptional regulator [Chryseobacterium luquanense]
MIISETLLLEYGAVYKLYDKNEIIFSENSSPQFYFQIIKGSVELTHNTPNGREFTHDIVSDGQSIGEFFLLSDRRFSCSAITITECEILMVCKSSFMHLLHKHPEINSSLLVNISKQMADQYMMSSNLFNTDPSSKIENVISHFKNEQNSPQFGFEVPFTRRQLANLTGLRVETVIRAVKKLESQHRLKIFNRRIYI